MNARITYEMHFVPHPWDEKARRQGTEAWVLFEVTTPDSGPPKSEPVALFNLDSEAERFQGHVFATNLDGQLVSINREMRELFTLQRRNR